MPRIEPLHSNLVVEEHALGEVSKGGLLLPQIANTEQRIYAQSVLEKAQAAFGAA